MALEKVVEIDQIEVKGEYSIQVRQSTKVMDGDNQIGGISYHRHVVHPNSDWSNDDPKVKKIADALFDADCIEAWHVYSNGYPSGTPSTSWELAQLQKYCDSISVSYEAGDADGVGADSKSKLVEKIEAKLSE
jgi:hypothetical protein